jgi:hypothetical protein
VGRPRTTTQYAVVYFPSDDQTTAAVGPFFSGERAHRAAEKIRRLEPTDGSANPAPVVVPLLTIEDALDDMLFEAGEDD